MSNLNLKTNQSGIDLIKQFEGFRGRKYNCPAGYPTVGFGHRVMAGENLSVISKAEAENLLKSDLTKYEQAVRETIRVSLNANQFAALVSFCYNVGPANLKRSSVARFTNQRNFARAAASLLKWNKARVNGELRPLRGLTARRMEERALFETPIKSDFSTVITASKADHPIDFSAYEEEIQPIEVPDLPIREIEPPPIDTDTQTEEKVKLTKKKTFTLAGLIIWFFSDVLGIPPDYVTTALNYALPYIESKPFRWVLIGVSVIGLYLYWKGYLSNIKARLTSAIKGFKDAR